ncbi:MAG: hypothetical protein NTV34_12405 [Proteobacteria bacterium]|nr:hypothetical protein [Pseudomonadota bacterium]
MAVLWILNGTYVCAGLAIFSAVVLQPIVGLPFLVIASTFVAYLLIVNDTGSLKKLIVPSLLSCCAIAYIAFVGVTSEGSNPSPPGILLTELTPSIFFNNISTWVRSDSLGLWWLSIAGFILLAVQGQIRRIEALIFSAWFLAALTIDGLFGATKWVVRFQSNYSTIGLLQLGWAAFILFGISKTKLLGRPARLCLTAIACVCWIVMNAYTLGFTWKPVSVFVNHSDVRLMRIADGIMPKNAKIFNMRPPENFNGWGQFCTGELWRPCWNHGFGSHEIASGNTRGTRQNLCSPTSDLFIKCLDQEGFNYLLLASRANSAEYATKLLQQGAIQELAVKSSFLFKLESGQDSSLR